MKVCFCASSGGHFEQLMMLKPLMEKYDSFIITEKTHYQVNENNEKMYQLAQVNRKEKFFVIKFLSLMANSMLIFIREKPQVVISTGALATIPICILAKLFKKKLIFIESFSKINSPTLTGKLLYRYADLFLIQWEDMQKHYPNAVYKGGIY